MTGDVANGSALDLRPAKGTLVRDRAEAPVVKPTVTIRITSGIGQGPNTLSAFDAALRAAGIANFNLLRLSSVIPTGAVLERPAPSEVHPAGGWGDRLYVVLAEMRVAESGDAWAGIGWVQDEATGRGLFVEHEGHSQTEVEGEIRASLASLCAGRPQSFGPPQMEIVGTPHLGQPTCALVAAVYESEPWRGETLIDLR
jgi:arginine decarboxylase